MALQLWIVLHVFIFVIHINNGALVPAESEPDIEIATVEVCANGQTSDGTCIVSPQESIINDATVSNQTFGQRLMERYFKYRKENPHLFDNQKSTAQGIRMENPNPKSYDMYWYDSHRRKGVFKGRIRPKGVSATNSYIGHVFYFTELNNEEAIVYRFAVEKDVSLYIIPAETEAIKESPRYKEILDKQKFLNDYLETHGYPWLAHYPRNPPILHMWPADYQHQIHTVVSQHNHWYCISGNPLTNDCEWRQKHGDITIKIEVLSTKPKLFAIEHTFSEDEADLIVALSKSRIKRSKAGTDGGMVTDTRTSENTWLDREHFVLETIYSRSANILNISETIMYNNKNAESLQVVHYGLGQEYKPHHDFGEDGRPQHRYITLLFFLNNQLNEHAGGETLFPHANDELGLALHAGKGNSLMFYNLLEDGNGDELTLHAGTPVKAGEKWLSNFWIWDPHR